MTSIPLPRRRSPLLAFMEIISDRDWRLKRAQWDGGPGIQAHDAAGRPHATDRLRITRRAFPPEAAAALGDGPVIERRRRHLIDGKPVQLSVSWYPAGTGADAALLRKNTGPGGALARLAGAGLAPVHFRERSLTRAATGGERAALGQPGLVEVTEITRHGTTEEGRVVEVTVMTLGEGYTLVYGISA